MASIHSLGSKVFLALGSQAAWWVTGSRRSLRVAPGSALEVAGWRAEAQAYLVSWSTAASLSLWEEPGCCLCH